MCYGYDKIVSVEQTNDTTRAYRTQEVYLWLRLSVGFGWPNESQRVR